MSYEVNIAYLDGVRLNIEARGHSIVSDQPRTNGGADSGMSPPELLLASLGSCIGFYAAEYLRTRHMDTAGLTVHVRAEKSLKPARLNQFEVVITAPACQEQKHKEGITRAAEKCLIHNTLLHTPDQSIALTINTSAALP